MNVTPAAVKVSEAKTRWGSCSEQKNINFSWRLCMAEPDTIDSVVVHELAHLKEMNHSDRFYKLVYNVMPDYDERNGKLKDLSKRLGYEDWEV
jgi:predicted metal-dependent hydrolase